MFAFSILLFTASSVIDKSFRQVLTRVNNSQLLLKLEIPNEFRLVTNHKIKHKENFQHYMDHTNTGETGVLMTLNHRASTQ